MKILLSEADFRDLVAGKTIKLHRSVDAVLDDIGWERMVGGVLDAMEERGLTLADLIRLAARTRPSTWPKSEGDDD